MRKFLVDKEEYKPLLLIWGSHKILLIGIFFFNNISIASLATLKPPFIPFSVTKLKSSREYYNDSLKNSLVEFVKVVNEQQLWTDDYFSKSIKSNRILLNERVSDD